MIELNTQTGIQKLVGEIRASLGAEFGVGVEENVGKVAEIKVREIMTGKELNIIFQEGNSAAQIVELVKNN